MDKQWEEDKHPRDDDGKFTSGGGTLAEHKRLQELGIEPRAKPLALPKQEYAELCSAIRTKCGNKIKRQDFILYNNSFYVYNYSRRSERITCCFKIQISGNEKLINKLENKYGRNSNS